MALAQPGQLRIAYQCICCGGNQLSREPAILMPFIADRVFEWRAVEIDNSWDLKSIHNGYAYSICNSVLCKHCHAMFLDIRFGDEQLGRLYKGYRDSIYIELREKYEPGYAERNASIVGGISYMDQVEDFLYPHLKFPVSILDWGGDTGMNTPFLKKNNRLIHIYDISNVEPIAGIKRVDKNQLLRNDYDLIICSNVLEHVPYPNNLLLEISEAMNKYSYLYIEVPYEKVMQMGYLDSANYLLKKHWHEHINFFSKASLESLVKKSKLDLVRLSVIAPNYEKTGQKVFQILCKLAAK